jgi:hypothetical protein
MMVGAWLLSATEREAALVNSMLAVALASLIFVLNVQVKRWRVSRPLDFTIG